MLLSFMNSVSGWTTPWLTASPSHGMLTAMTSYYWLSALRALAKTSSRSSGSASSVKFLRDDSLLRKSDHMSRMLAKVVVVMQQEAQVLAGVLAVLHDLERRNDLAGKIGAAEIIILGIGAAARQPEGLGEQRLHLMAYSMKLDLELAAGPG